MKLDDAAAHLEALGNPTRLKIYRMLIRAGGAGLAVGRLQEKLKIAPSTLSHHIKALVVVGLVTQVRDATTLVCHAMRAWGHVQLFSPWEYNIDKEAARLLATTGWNSPAPDQYPTGAEMVERYLEPLANNTALRPHIQKSSRVTGISRVGFDKMKTKG